MASFRNMRYESDLGRIQDQADSTDWRTVDQAMDRAGKPQPDGAYNYSLPRSDLKAAITGDFVMTADEVNPVLKALAGAGIQVNALHNHMLNEEPRLFFVHFWANDDAEKLALESM